MTGEENDAMIHMFMYTCMFVFYTILQLYVVWLKSQVRESEANSKIGKFEQWIKKVGVWKKWSLCIEEWTASLWQNSENVSVQVEEI